MVAHFPAPPPPEAGPFVAAALRLAVELCADNAAVDATLRENKPALALLARLDPAAWQALAAATRAHRAAIGPAPGQPPCQEAPDQAPRDKPAPQPPSHRPPHLPLSLPAAARSELRRPRAADDPTGFPF